MSLKTVRSGRTLGEDGRPMRFEHKLDDCPPLAITLNGAVKERPGVPPNPETCPVCGATIRVGDWPCCWGKASW